MSKVLNGALSRLRIDRGNACTELEGDEEYYTHRSDCGLSSACDLKMSSCNTACLCQIIKLNLVIVVMYQVCMQGCT